MLGNLSFIKTQPGREIGCALNSVCLCQYPPQKIFCAITGTREDMWWCLLFVLMCTFPHFASKLQSCLAHRTQSAFPVPVPWQWPSDPARCARNMIFCAGVLN